MTLVYLHPLHLTEKGKIYHLPRKRLLHIKFYLRSTFSTESHIASASSVYIKIDAEARYLITQVSFSVIKDHLLPEPRNKLHFLSNIMTMMLQR